MKRYGERLPVSGPGGPDSYYYFAGGPSTVRNRQRDDLYTLEYSGHHCIDTMCDGQYCVVHIRGVQPERGVAIVSDLLRVMVRVSLL